MPASSAGAERGPRTDPMSTFRAFFLLFALCTPALATETLITKRKSTDAITLKGQEAPAQTQTELTWVGKDRMRVDLGAWSTIVRMDQKKLYQIHHDTQSYSVVDLPYDAKRYMTPAQAKALDKALEKVTVTVTPTSETRKFKEWTATKYVMNMTPPKGGSFTEEIWAVGDVGIDTAAWFEMWGTRMSLQPIGALMAAEQKKIIGLPVFVERSQTQGTVTSTARDEVLSIECKEAPEGTFEVPKDYKERPFDLADASMKVRPPVEAEIVPIPPPGKSSDGTPPVPVPK